MAATFILNQRPLSLVLFLLLCAMLAGNPPANAQITGINSVSGTPLYLGAGNKQYVVIIPPDNAASPPVSNWNGGFVGIGTAFVGGLAPVAPLQVWGGTNQDLLFRTPWPGASISTGMEIGSVNDANNAWQPLEIDGSITVLGMAGNVGIGTATPGVMLDVNGGTRPGSENVVTACGTGQANGEGTQRYNYSTHTMEYCNGTGWTSVSGGIPRSCTMYCGGPWSQTCSHDGNNIWPFQPQSDAGPNVPLTSLNGHNYTTYSVPTGSTVADNGGIGCGGGSNQSYTFWECVGGSWYLQATICSF